MSNGKRICGNRICPLAKVAIFAPQLNLESVGKRSEILIYLALIDRSTNNLEEAESAKALRTKSSKGPLSLVLDLMHSPRLLMKSDIVLK
jgi:hypothetical protein